MNPFRCLYEQSLYHLTRLVISPKECSQQLYWGHLGLFMLHEADREGEGE